jgi:hypothetical protein
MKDISPTNAAFIGLMVGLFLTSITFVIFDSDKQKESRTVLRMTLEDGRRLHFPLSPQDEALVDRNGGEIKIKSLEFRRKE